MQGFTLSHLLAYAKSTVGIVPNGMDSLACHSLEDSQEFWSCQDSTSLVAVIRLVVYRQDISIGGSLAHKLTLAIHATCRCLANHLCLAIAVEVIDEELGIVGTCTDVLPQVDAPEFLAVQFVAIKDDITRITVVRVVVRIGRIPFQDDFILTISIHISHATIIRGIGIGASVGSRSSLWAVNRQRLVEVCPRFHFLRHLTRGDSIRLGHLLIGYDVVSMGRRAILIGIVGSLDMGSDDLAVSFHIKANVLAIGAQHTPTHEDALTLRRQSHNTSIQMLHIRR